MQTAIAIRLYSVLTFVISLLRVPHSDAYVTDSTYNVKQKIFLLQRELLMDVIFKIEEIENLKLKESRTTAYRQGEVAYHARRKWRQMLKIYFKNSSNMDSQTHSQMIRDLASLQRLDMDIYHATENMHQLEADGDQHAPGQGWRRSGSGSDNRSHMRRYLAATDKALRDRVRKQSDHIRSIFPRTKPPSIDIHHELQFLDNNASELIYPTNNTDNFMSYDPEFIIPFMYPDKLD